MNSIKTILKKIDIKILIIILITTTFHTCCYYIGTMFSNNANLIGSTFDKNLSFISNFVFLYLLWHPMLLLVPYIVFIYDKERVYKYISMIFISSLIALLIYIIYPTTINRYTGELKGISGSIVKRLYKNDPPVCCFPSFHVIISCLFIYLVAFNKKIKNYTKIIITFLSIGIIVSTLFIKQHVLLDVVGGVLVTVASYFIVKILNLNNLLKRIIKEAKLMKNTH